MDLRAAVPRCSGVARVASALFSSMVRCSQGRQRLLQDEHIITSEAAAHVGANTDDDDDDDEGLKLHRTQLWAHRDL